MKIGEALKRAEKNENVQKLKGYFLGSCFASLTEISEVGEWTLLYYSPAAHKVVDCFVNDRFVTVGEETPAINEIQELDTSVVKVDIDKAMGLVKGKVGKKAINILISLHKKIVSGKTYTVWTIAFVTQDMSVTSFDVDADSGKLLKEETTKLIKRL